MNRDVASQIELEKIRFGERVWCVFGCMNSAIYTLEVKASRRANGRSIPPRRLYKCASCRRQFTVTVGSVLERTKIPLSVWVVLLRGGRMVPWEEIRRRFGLHYEPSYDAEARLAEFLRTGTLERDMVPYAEWQKIERSRSHYRLPPQPRVPDRWPFIETSSDAFTDRVNAIVPRALPEGVRQEVCQEIAVAMLEGTPEEEIRQSIAKYVRRYFSLYESSFRLSLDKMIEDSPYEAVL